jgi:hypothetical protein
VSGFLDIAEFSLYILIFEARAAGRIEVNFGTRLSVRQYEWRNFGMGSSALRKRFNHSPGKWKYFHAALSDLLSIRSTSIDKECFYRLGALLSIRSTFIDKERFYR